MESLSILESLSLTGVGRSGEYLEILSISILGLGLLGGIISCVASRSIFSTLSTTSSLEFCSMLCSFLVDENTGKTFQQKTKLTAQAKRR